jgi:hypothetical protein
MLLRSLIVAMALLAAPALASPDAPAAALTAILDRASALQPLETVVVAHRGSIVAERGYRGQAKFSYAWLAGMILHGIDTASDATYVDALGADSRRATFARRVTVTGDDRLSDTATEGDLILASGAKVPVAHDLAARLPVAALESGLRAKARALIGAKAADELWDVVADLDQRSARALDALLRRQ